MMDSASTSSTAGLAPRCVAVTLTTACNLSCAYCYQSHAATRRIPWHILRRALDLVVESPRSDVAVSFWGGEPLLELAMMSRAVAYLDSREQGANTPRLQISTNGLLLDRATLDFLAAHHVHTQLSFDGVASAQDARAPGSFEALDLLLLIMKAEYRDFFNDLLGVRITLTAQNLPHLAESVGYFLERGVCDISIAPATTHEPEWRNASIDELHRQLEDVFSISLETYRKSGHVPLAHLRRSGLIDGTRREAPVSLCGLATGDNLAVDVDGSLFACPLAQRSMRKLRTPLLGEFNDMLEVGSLADDDLDAKVEEFRGRVASLEVAHLKEKKRSSYGLCGKCRFLGECFVCPASIAHRPGDPDPNLIPDIQCAMNLVALDHRRRFPPPNPVAELLRAQGRRVSDTLGMLLASAAYQEWRGENTNFTGRETLHDSGTAGRESPSTVHES